MKEVNPLEKQFIVVDPKDSKCHAKAVYCGPHNDDIKLFKCGDVENTPKNAFSVGLAKSFTVARPYCPNEAEYMVICCAGLFCLSSVAFIGDDIILLENKKNIKYERGSKFILKPSSKK